ncbi:MAG TPA: M1 family aminopeptidase [Terriglobales bacterium]|nr:M1 family aminopeptidase [Terriglobales bacterium]
MSVLLLTVSVSAQDDEQMMHNAMPAASPPGPLPEPFRIGSPRAQGQVNSATATESAQLYRQLRDMHLDGGKVFRIREASIEREDVHITLEDGVIGFTRAVNGRITGAFFEGEGEILLIPPDRVEKRSLGLFTKAAVLEEKLTSAFFRFNDDLADELMAATRGEAEDPAAFVNKWDTTVNSLSEADALRLMTSFLNGTTVNGKATSPEGDHMLRARISGEHLGVFDLFFDTDAREQISVGQLTRDQYGRSFFNVWTAFPMRSMRMRARQRVSKTGTNVTPAALGSTTDLEPEDRLHITDYKMNIKVKPPSDLDAECVMNADVVQGGQRVILLELSRNLRVSTIEYNGKPLEYLQNEALEGTALARRGNDLVALIFPETLQTGQKLQLRFVYGGSVMSDAGGGLLYVGARGIWYPNRGVSMANFDLEFTHPSEWTLVATGRRVSGQTTEGEMVSRWKSDRPIPLAGFNLGHYQRAEAKLGNVPIEVYAAQGVEKNMQMANKVLVEVPTIGRRVGDDNQTLVTLPGPSPSQHAQQVADRVQKGLAELSEELGPYPYDSLVLSQMPGRMSQGWPGLIFLSSYVFLTPDEMQRSKIEGADAILYSNLMPIHESAHQWWGDLVGWKSYRDQWLVEALANYCALAAMEKNQPKEVQQVLELYRKQLLMSNKDKMPLSDAGPVTLGVRLFSSQFPNGYDAISYGRGTWIFHMLRNMMRDAEPKSAKSENLGDEPFFRVLRKICERYQGKSINNKIVQQVFEEELPESLRFEGRKSLDWFFDEWVNGTSIPKLQVSNVKFTNAAGGSTVTGKLVQEEAPIELVTSVPIYGVTAKKDLVLLGRVFADGPETTFRLKAPAGVHRIEIDPYDTVLRRP